MQEQDRSMALTTAVMPDRIDFHRAHYTLTRSADYPRRGGRVDDSAGSQHLLGVCVHNRRPLTTPNRHFIQLHETLNDRDRGAVGAPPYGKYAAEVVHLGVTREHDCRL